MAFSRRVAAAALPAQQKIDDLCALSLESVDAKSAGNGNGRFDSHTELERLSPRCSYVPEDEDRRHSR